MSARWAMLAASVVSTEGVAANHASRISSSAASLVRRRESARTLASFHFRAPSAVWASPHSAARMPGTLLAAIDAPVPVQQQTTACSARPSATSRAAASEAQAQSSRSPSARAPWTIGSWPRRRSWSTTASATPVRSSLETAIRTARRIRWGCMTTLSPEALERVRAQRWYHTLELAPGVVTDGWFDLRDQVGHYRIPERLDGLRVLEVGTWDGFWAFELERRGAAEVVALDLDDERDLDWPPRRRPTTFPDEPRGAGFALAA